MVQIDWDQTSLLDLIVFGRAAAYQAAKVIDKNEVIKQSSDAAVEKQYLGSMTLDLGREVWLPQVSEIRCRLQCKNTQQFLERKSP